jgi:hypothetical protein
MARYEVLVKGDESRCLLNGKGALHGTDMFLRHGWNLVWPDAPSALEGWAWALKQYKAMPADYDDTYMPDLINEPTVLFRSVSLEEMSHILEIGAVKGGGNGFNDFETRPFVFFSPALTEKTMWQGEEAERQASQRLSKQPIVAEFERAERELEEFLKEVEDRARRKVEEINIEREEEGWPLLMTAPDDWDKFRRRWSYNTFNDIVGYLKNSKKIFEKMSDLEDAVDGVRNRYLDLHRETTEEIARENKALTYSSAVIETVPITHGFHYSNSFGKSGMGEEDEYGLFPNQVTEDDIVRVHWVKDNVVLRTTDLEGAREIMEQIDRERAALYGTAPAMA